MNIQEIAYLAIERHVAAQISNEVTRKCKADQ